MRFYKLRVFPAAAEATPTTATAQTSADTATVGGNGTSTNTTEPDFSITNTLRAPTTQNTATGLTNAASTTDLINISSLDQTGNPNPGALMIEVDISLAPYHVIAGARMVRIWGVGLAAIAQALQLVGNQVELTLGMSKGLPLANPAEQGAPITGVVQQAFGNWQGVNQNLTLVFLPLYGAPPGVARATGDTALAPANIVFNWAVNQPMTDAVTAALQTAFPQATVQVSISASLVATSAETTIFPSLQEFSRYLNARSLDIVKNQNYVGVSVSTENNSVINVYDGTQASGSTQTPTAIAYTDLIGQPVWNSLLLMQFICVMRGDLAPGDYVTMPNTIVQQSAASYSQYRTGALSFAGTFFVTKVRLVGNSRTPSAESWVTVVDCALQSPA